MQKFVILPVKGQTIETPEGPAEVLSASYLKDMPEAAKPDFVFKVRSVLGDYYDRLYFSVTVQVRSPRGPMVSKRFHSWQVTYDPTIDDDAPPWR